MLKDIFISENASIKDVLKKLDKTAEKVLLVVDENKKLLGTITDGDIRRFILKGNSDFEYPVTNIYHKNPIYISKENYTLDLLKKLMTRNKVELIPLTDKENRVVDFISWDEAFSDKKTNKEIKNNINLPVIIMAGGKGTRLEPFTKVLPKPLIPLGEKTIIETIIDRFKFQGAKQFYIILNYRGEMIEAYFKSVQKDFILDFIWEQSFKGTAGGLTLLEEYIDNSFIMSNCDVLVDVDFADVIKFHQEKESYLTILSSIQHYKLPYGVVKFKEGGEVIEIIEKPEYTNTINTGVYILNKEVLKYIPDEQFFDMTQLIQALLNDRKKVLTYPINESEYVDIGQWEEYQKAVQKLNLIL